MHHDHVGRVLNSYSDFVAIPEDDLGRDLSRSRSVSVAICLSRDLSRSRSVTVAICLSRDLSRSRSVTVAICHGRDLSRSRSVSVAICHGRDCFSVMPMAMSLRWINQSLRPMTNRMFHPYKMTGDLFILLRPLCTQDGIGQQKPRSSQLPIQDA